MHHKMVIHRVLLFAYYNLLCMYVCMLCQKKISHLDIFISKSRIFHYDAFLVNIILNVEEVKIKLDFLHIHTYILEMHPSHESKFSKVKCKYDFEKY